MSVTRQSVATQLASYLRHELPLADLVAWAEQQMMDADFDSLGTRDVVARLGVADVREFGLTWEDCESLLRLLGFTAHVEIVTA